MKPLNLASEPFRNERLPQVVLGLGTVLVLAMTLIHARAIVRLLPRSTSKLAQEVSSMEEEGGRLRADAARLRNTKPNAADAARWAILKELVDRRVFSWTRLFGVLEESLPMGVRLVSITPKVERGQFAIGLSAVARSVEDGFEMIRILDERPEFDNVRPVGRNATDQGIAFTYIMNYNASAAPPPKPSPSPSPEASAAGAAGPAREQP